MTAVHAGPAAPRTALSTSDGPLWYLRVNTLRRSRLADAELRKLLADLLLVEQAVHAAAQRCSAELYQLVGATTDDVVHRELVELRRTIHNDRTPRAEFMPTPSVADWFGERRRRQALRDAIVAGYPRAVECERGVLADLLGDEDLCSSLGLVAPEVHRESQRYRQAVADARRAGTATSAKARKSERGLIQYVTRAMVRTSPLARFTAVGLAVPDPGGPDPDAVGYPGAVVFPSLDRVMLGYLVGGLGGPDEGDPINAWVGLPPTSAVDGGTLFFLRLTPAGIKRLSVPVNAQIGALLSATAMGPRRVPSVAAHVAGRLGCTETDALRLVLGAAAQGILCSFNEAEDGNADLDLMLTQPDTPAAGLLADVRDRLPLLASTEQAARAEHLARIADGLAQASHLAGRPAQVTVEEDHVLPPSIVDPTRWLGALADVGSAVELLSLFDWLHDVRAVLAAAFVERFGRGAHVPLAEHADMLVDEVSRRTGLLAAEYEREGTDYAALAALGPKDGSLGGLFRLRRTVSQAMHAELAAAAAQGRPELRLSTVDVDSLLAVLPERFRREPLSYGVMLQSAGDRLIVNDGLPGHGMLYARFLDADGRLGGQALTHLAQRLAHRYGWDGSEVVEDLGLHRLNVNAHPPILPTGLTPDDWFTLRLAHDEDTDALYVQDADGRRVRVLPMGTGHPELFPPPLSIAAGLVISGRLYNNLPDTWHRATPWDERTTRVCPRMAVGNAVISRRRWYGGAELAAAVAAGPEETDRLLALTSWRARHDVPAEVVIKTTPADDRPTSPRAPDAQSRRLTQKPQYVDLASALSTRVLPRMLDRRGGDGPAAPGYLEEALPGVVDGTYATEWVVEISREPGGRFEYDRRVR